MKAQYSEFQVACQQRDAEPDPRRVAYHDSEVIAKG